MAQEIAKQNEEPVPTRKAPLKMGSIQLPEADLAPLLQRLESLEQQLATLKRALKDFYDVEGKGSVG